MKLISNLIESTISLSDQTESFSPDRKRDLVSYRFKDHKPKEILQCIFRSLHNEQEKLSFTTLKLLDMLLEKNIPKVLDHLLFNSVKRSTSKLVRDRLYKSQAISEVVKRYFTQFPLA